jgi:hypothetical protein
MTVTQQVSCDQCGALFSSARPWARYCSPACRVRADRARKAAGPPEGGTYGREPAPPVTDQPPADPMENTPDRTHEVSQDLSGTAPAADLSSAPHAPAPNSPPHGARWRHADRERALNLLQCHLGYASEAREALGIIEQLADPCVTSLEQYVREAAPRREIRPLLERP